MIGVDLFVLYDNGSSDGGGDLIRAVQFARNVTIIGWQERPGQLSAYNHFRHKPRARRFTWAAFIDIDEFIMPLDGSSIRDILMRGPTSPTRRSCCNGWCSARRGMIAARRGW